MEFDTTIEEALDGIDDPSFPGRSKRDAYGNRKPRVSPPVVFRGAGLMRRGLGRVEEQRRTLIPRLKSRLSFNLPTSTMRMDYTTTRLGCSRRSFVSILDSEVLGTLSRRSMRNEGTTRRPSSSRSSLRI